MGLDRNNKTGIVRERKITGWSVLARLIQLETVVENGVGRIY